MAAHRHRAAQWDVSSNPLQFGLGGCPWRIAIASLLLSRTNHKRVRPILAQLLKRWPTPKSLAVLDPWVLSRILHPLGYVERRTRTLIAMSKMWDREWETLLDLPGVGPYVADAVAIFCFGGHSATSGDTVLVKYLQELSMWMCVKRNGEEVPFDEWKIRHAITRCFQSVNQSLELVPEILRRVMNSLRSMGSKHGVEDIQRVVIQQLWGEGLFLAAEHYSTYREEHRRAREHVTSPELQALVTEDQRHFPTDLQYYQFVSKFARWRGTRRETWHEACHERVMPWLFARVPGLLSDAECQSLTKAVYDLEVSPAMRVVQMAGPALDRCNVGVYNCAYMPVDDVRSFQEFLYILMQGTGVGFSVEDRYIEQLPRVAKWRRETRTIAVEDSAEGWCDAFGEAMQRWFDGSDVHVDVTGVRPAGARLVTKGGRASGPDVFLQLISYARNVMRAHQGRRLTDVAVHRIMCMIGKIVQVGDMRRAATISLSDLDSQHIRDVKSGQWWQSDPYWPDGRHLSMANNSAVYEETPDIETFTAEWLALMRSKSGERGIFNRAAVLASRPKRRSDAVWGTNPCGEIQLRPREFCVSGDTRLITRGKLVRIADVVNKEIEIWNGRRWSRVAPKKTGENQQLVRVWFSDGSHIDCTPDHRFSVNNIHIRGRKGEDVWLEVQAKDLRTSKPRMATETFVIQYTEGEILTDAYTLGVLLGDGCFARNQVHVDLYGEKIGLPVTGTRGPLYLPPGCNVPRVHVNTGSSHVENFLKLRGSDEETWMSLFSYNRSSILAFLAGWFDADGTNCAGGGVRLYSTNQFNLEMVQLLLTKCGIRSSLNEGPKAGTKNNYGIRKLDGWFIQVTDCADLPCHRLDTSRGHQARFKGKFQVVHAVEYLPGLHDVYCFEESQEHKAVFNNTLTYQCNLSISVARPNDDVASLRRKVRLATILGVIQSTCTKFNYIRDDWRLNCEEERLLGVDITGHADSPLLRYGAPGRAELLRDLRGIVAATADEFAARFGIARSAADTCVKPSGDSAVFFDCASGVSPRFAHWQIRWVRQPKRSPVARFLRDSGVPCADAPEDASLYVFGFPKQAPEGCTLRDDMTAVQQFHNWLEWKREWAEHSVSATIYVAPNEWLELGALVYRHFGEVAGLSFLPRDNGTYTYAPNEEITREQYEEMVRTFPQLNWAKLPYYELEDETTVAGTHACHGDRCEG
jgi:ribonucleotide reductase class II